MIHTRIVIFAKVPLPGLVKTRLIPALGASGAARLAHQMLMSAVAEAVAAGLGIPELCGDPHPLDPRWNGLLPPQALHATDQGGGDLGARLARAAERVIGGGENVLLVGADCPDLDYHRLREAAAVLAAYDAVIHPAEDGGYVLLGLRHFDPSLFTDIAWSTPVVANTTAARVRALGWTLHIGKTLKDIDVPADLASPGLVEGGA